MKVGMRFGEAMAGTWRRPGEAREMPIRFDVEASTPTPLEPLGTVTGSLAGTISVGELAARAPATGSIEVSPVQHRRIRYTLDFTADDGRRYRLDGWKSIDWLRVLSSWTTLPTSITDDAGDLVGTATLRFDLRDTPRLAASARLRPAPADPAALWAAGRWDGRPGRLEVWYDTFTDPDSGDGFWLHHELAAPAGGGPAEMRGWMAVFPADGTPRWERFGPEPARPGGPVGTGEVVATAEHRKGRAGGISWDLHCETEGEPLFTFPAAAWRRELLPGAQIVPGPTAAFSGTVSAGERVWNLRRARGGAARIYGHGSAERWAWLHADLGEGEVLEVVAAVPRRRLLEAMPPLPMVRLRTGGRDWPASPLVGAARLRARIGLPGWEVRGRVGDRRVAITVDQPPERCVTIDYHDPDGSTATCTNTERADATVLLERRAGGRWETERRWDLPGRAHAEVGTRP